ncbi:hypothetical protein ACWJJH_02210 [Endozoicomonadaceae bacterium StTr2]
MNIEDLIVLERNYWTVNHRTLSTYPGYLMIQARERAAELSGLNNSALLELGPVMAEVESLLQHTFSPRRIIFSKLGFSAGHSSHFHVLPVYDWLLQEIVDNPQWINNPDGNDVMLYVNRIYCEQQHPEQAEKITREAIQQINNTLAIST